VIGLSPLFALQMPWEKEAAKAKEAGPSQGAQPGATKDAAPGLSAVEFVYRGAMDEMHARHGGKLRVGDPKISPTEIRVHVAVAGSGDGDLVFVEKENDGKSAMVVVGPPDSEGEPYYLVRAGDSWAKAASHVPPMNDRNDVDSKIAEVADVFFLALRNDDVAKAYALTSPMYRERVDERGFRAFLGRWPALREHGVAGVVNARNHRGVGLAEVELHVSEAVAHKTHLEFDDVDGQWRVGLVEISGPQGAVPAKSEQSPMAFIGDDPPAASAAEEAAVRRVMALPEVATLADRLKAEPRRFGAPAARVEDMPSDEQRKQYGFRFHGIAVGYDDSELARFMTWRRFAVDAETGEIRAYDVAEDKYVPINVPRGNRKKTVGGGRSRTRSR